MASRVNTKFVILLSVAVIALLGLVAVAYSVVKKSGDDHVAAGDKMMEAGDYERAKILYGKAVYKDPSRADWMDKWINSMESMTPETETAYRDAFQKDYLGALSFISTVQRTNVDAHRKILDIQYRMLQIGYTRSAADTLISTATKALSYFDGQPAGNAEWHVLRRYRGLGYDRVAQAKGVITDDEFALYREDLQAAVNADPSDDKSRAALIRWGLAKAERDSIQGDNSLMLAARDAAIAECDAYLETNPGDPMISTLRLTMQMDQSRQTAGEGLEDAERTVAIMNAFGAFKPRLDQQFDALAAMDTQNLSTSIVEQMLRVERAADPKAKLAQTRALMDRLVDADPTNPNLLWVSGRVNTDGGDREAAIARFESILALSPRTVSFEGMMLYTRKRLSMVSIANMRLDQYQIANLESEGDEPVRPELLEEVRSLVTRFAEGVSGDDNQLLMLNGRVAEAEGDLSAALGLYKKYNEQTKREVAEGMWREGAIARQLGQLGTAKTALNQVLALKGHDPRALLALADIQMRLNDYRSAGKLYEQILIYDPTNEFALKGLESCQAIENPEGLAEENPALALVLRARQIRLGVDGQPGDLSSAIELLRQGIVDPKVNFNPNVSRELAMLLMDNGDVAGARSVIEQSAANNPDDEVMARMVGAMQGDDPVEILATLINQSEQPELDKGVSLANLYMQKGRGEQLDAMLAELNELAPEDRRVLELSFTRALQLKDTAAIERLAERAVQNNYDGVRGLTFKARQAALNDDHEGAVELLQQAGALGTADATVYRMLAMEQRVLGQTDAAADSFEQALSIRPDDHATIYEYVATLTQAGRYEPALEVARAYQKYGSTDVSFNNLWLMLEASYGGDEGRDFAIRQRERMLELNSADRSNMFELAKMYVSAQKWDEAKTLIETLRAGGDSLALVELQALWFADQGRVGKQNGLVLARDAFQSHIDSLGDEVTEAPFIVLARFMLNRGRPDLAVQAANEAIALENPETMEGSKLLGDLQITLNQFANAATAYERVIESNADPEHQYRSKLIECYLRLHRYEDALGVLDALPEDTRNTKIALLQRAELLNGLERIGDSRAVLDDVVTRFPDDPLVFIKRAESMIGEPELMTDLLSDVDQALKLNGNDWRAYRVRAAAYFAADRRRDAMEDLQSAVRINPNLDSALFGVLNELINDNRPGEALDLAKEVIERRPNDAPLMTQIGHLFAARLDWNRARELYGMAWEKRRSPSDGAIYIDALVRSTPPDTDAANEVITNLAELAGGINKSPGLLAAQALVLDARGRTDFAIQQLTKAFDLSLDEDAKLLGWYGNVARFYDGKPIAEEIAYLDSIRRREELPAVRQWVDLFITQRLAREGVQTGRARGLLDTLITKSETPRLQRIAYQTYGSMLFTIEDYEGAQDIWGKGVGAFPEDWEMNNNLAYALSEKLDRSEEALKYGEAAVSAGITRSEPYETLVRIYTKLGRHDDADRKIKEGMPYAISLESRITMILAESRLRIAQGELDAARSQLINAESLFRTLPGTDEDIERTIEQVREEILSAG